MENNKRIEFESVQPFDIIWAERDIDETEIYDNDRNYEGSYLVIGRGKDKLYCLRGGQNIREFHIPYIVFSRLTKNKYNEEKIIYYVNKEVKIITYSKFINKKTRLNIEEKRDLVCELKKQRIITDRKYYDIDLSIKSGDIVKKDDILYLVVYKYNDSLHCLEIKDESDLANSLYISNLNFINYNNTVILNVSDDVEYINKISNQFFKRILKKYREENYNLIEYLNKKRNMTVGLLIRFNDILYYVYNIDEDSLFCYVVEFGNDDNYNIIISNKKYIININTSIIVRIADIFESLSIANEEEIRVINNLIDTKKKTKKLLK